MKDRQISGPFPLPSEIKPRRGALGSFVRRLAGEPAVDAQNLTPNIEIASLKGQVEELSAQKNRAETLLASVRALLFVAQTRAIGEETRATRVEGRLSQLDFPDPHGYYNRLGITPAFFKGKTQEQIEVMLNALKRGYGQIFGATISVPEGKAYQGRAQNEIKNTERLQAINEAADRLKDPRYR